MMQYLESRRNNTTFAFLPYVPAYSRYPTKSSFSPQPDHTNYLVTINNQLKTFGKSKSLKTCFSNKKVDMNSKKDNYKGPDWQGYSSTAESHLSFENCFFYTSNVLRQRFFDFYIHVNNFVNSITWSGLLIRSARRPNMSNINVDCIVMVSFQNSRHNSSTSIQLLY